MSELTVEVAKSDISYPLKIEKDLLGRLDEEIKAIYTNKKIAIVTDENVSHFYGDLVKNKLSHAGFEVKLIVVAAGEQSKSPQVLLNLYSDLIEFKLSRSDLLIALGGGVIGDLAGFAAATYLRGISFVQIPTTLLAQVDSSVGGKVAIDLAEGKNLVGAFYHPVLVIIDPNLLETLTDSTFYDGMAEVIKYGCIQDASFFEQLTTYHSRAEIMVDIEQIIERCCAMKRDLVQADEKDTASRMLLNFGHTVGHAIESYYHYQKYTHGQAISIGMLAINEIAEAMGISQKGSTAAIRNLLKQHHLPTELANVTDYEKILPYISRDKKNIQNSLFVVVLNKIGDASLFESKSDFFTPLLKGEEAK